MYERVSHPGMGPCLPRVGMALRTPGWSFHTLQGGNDPWSHHFRPRFAAVVDVWRDLPSRARTLSFSGGAGSTNPTLEFPHRAERYLSEGGTVFVRGLPESWMYRNISHPGLNFIFLVDAGCANPTLGFPYRTGRYRSSGPPFSSPVRRSCRCIEGLLVLRFWASSFLDAARR